MACCELMRRAQQDGTDCESYHACVTVVTEEGVRERKQLLKGSRYKPEPLGPVGTHSICGMGDISFCPWCGADPLGPVGTHSKCGMGDISFCPWCGADVRPKV